MVKETIEEIVDRTLNSWVENEANQLPCDIEEATCPGSA
ncbi:hypothetical protein J2Y40_002407 [Chryseobacterium sp. 2987]|nr:hypothetical protein [Chryseobacterium sp. 2987]